MTFELAPTTPLTGAGISIPVNLAAPSIPAINEGDVALSSNGQWSNNPSSFIKTWLRNGNPVGSVFQAPAGSAGDTLQLSVVARNAAGDSVAKLSNIIIIGVATPTSLSVITEVASALTGVVPYSFGLPVDDGEVNASVNATGDSDTFQARATSFYPSGNPRHLIISGTKTIAAANTDTAISLSNAPQPGGTDVSLADLRARATTGAINGIGLSTILADAPHETIVSGPVMSQWAFRRVIDATKAVVLWLEVWCWSTGHVNIMPRIENGHMGMASDVATNDVRTWSVNINGQTVFNQSIDLKAFAVMYLISNRFAPYPYDGVEYDVTVKHDISHLANTGQLMNSSTEWAPTEDRLNSRHTGYIWGERAKSCPARMGNAGGNASNVNPETMYYMTSDGDARAYVSLMVEAMHAGSYGAHRRSPTTHFAFSFSEMLDRNIQSYQGGSHLDQTTATTHQPEFGYSAWLLTGISSFRDECFAWASLGFLKADANVRLNEKGLCWTFSSALSVRGAAWQMRNYAQSLAIMPPSHPAFASYKYALEENYNYLRAVYVDGDSTILGSVPYRSPSEDWVSPMGCMGRKARYGSPEIPDSPAPIDGRTDFSPSWLAEGFQLLMWPAMLGYTARMNLPISTQAQADHLALRDHNYKLIIGLLGGPDNDPSGWNWRRCMLYSFPIGHDAPELGQWYTFKQAYYCYINGAFGVPVLGEIPDTEGFAIKRHSSNTESITSYWGNYLGFIWAALCHAVDDGVPGATDCYRRFTGASNFISTNSTLAGSPSWAVRPRT